MLEVRPADRWITEQYPVEVVEDDGDVLGLTLVVTTTALLGRLLLRLGPEVSVVGGDPRFGDTGPEAARRVLDGYETTA